MVIGLKLSNPSYLNCQEVVAIFKNKKNNVAFVDVRNRKTYVQGFAFGAINCPLERFSKTIDDLVPDKSTYLILIGANVASVKQNYFISI